jgi:predicted histone-like DNA-binding protein
LLDFLITHKFDFEIFIGALIMNYCFCAKEFQKSKIIFSINHKKLIFMSVKYTVSAKGNPSKPSDPKKWYANAKANGEVTFKELSKEISQRSTTVSDTDVMAVLNDLTKLLARHLETGKIVRLGDFGSFQVSVKSEGAETEEKFHASLIKKAKINFRPGIDLKDMLLTLKYNKIE